MKVFVWVNSVFATLGVFFYSWYLSTKTYPRTETITPRMDVIKLLMDVVILAWAMFLLILNR
jgi:hypothetical protein